MYQFPEGTAKETASYYLECNHQFYCYETWEWRDSPYGGYFIIRYICRCIYCGFSLEEGDC